MPDNPNAASTRTTWKQGNRQQQPKRDDKKWRERMKLQG